MSETANNCKVPNIILGGSGSITSSGINVDGKNNHCFTLDELLSPAALELLNGQGYVCFKIMDAWGDRAGWFSRKKKTIIESEAVVIGANSGF